MTSNEWIARKWRAIRTSSAIIALAAIAVGSFLLFHGWSFSSSRQGTTGTCAAVVSAGQADTLSKLDVPPETATAFCNQQRSEHAREAIEVLAFAVLVAGFSIWAHTQSRRAIRVGIDQA